MEHKILEEIKLLKERKSICEDLLAQRQKEIPSELAEAGDIEEALTAALEEIKTRKMNIEYFDSIITELEMLVEIKKFYFCFHVSNDEEHLVLGTWDYAEAEHFILHKPSNGHAEVRTYEGNKASNDNYEVVLASEAD